MLDPFARNGVSLERLRSLELVVREGTISAASNGDPNRQSLLSRQVAELEEALGIALLDRSAKPYRPTAVAERLAKSCRDFVREVEDASAADNRGAVTVGAAELVIRHLLIPWIGAHRKRTAGVSWRLRNMPARRVQEGLAAESLDLGFGSSLADTGTVRVKEIGKYGMKLLMPENQQPDKSGWDKLAVTPVVLIDGSGSFRGFLADCLRERGIRLELAAECTSYLQAVELATVAGWAVFVPAILWRRHKEWAPRTHHLPGLAEYHHTLLLGWNEKLARRRPDVKNLVAALARSAA